MRSVLGQCLILALGSAATQPLPAQSLPRFSPINPMAASRSGLQFEPYVERSDGWRLALSLDYANLTELNTLDQDTMYVLDAEVARLAIDVTHDVSLKVFAFAQLSLNGSYDGFLDGFLDSYHALVGLNFPERDARPPNTFEYRVGFADGSTVTRSKSGAFLGDTRLGIGRRHSSHHQTTLSVTLPTSTGPTGYGRGTLSGNMTHTFRTAPTPNLVMEASAGVGHTPTTGDLARFQRSWFVMGTAGGRWRFWGPQWLYANIMVHSPYYHDTFLLGLDEKDLSIDFGWILARSGGKEWRIGLVEDPERTGPAADIVFRFGATF